MFSCKKNTENKFLFDSFSFSINTYADDYLSFRRQENKVVIDIRKNIFVCLFSVHKTISLSRHEQVCLIRLHFQIYFSHHQAT